VSTVEQTGEKTMIRGMDLSGYLVRDPQRAIAFYRDVLGLEPTATDEQGRGAEFTLADGTTFGVWNSGDGSETTGGFIMFTVDDARQATEKLRARGLKLSDPMESPVCFMSFGQDPDGNGFAIHQRKDRS